MSTENTSQAPEATGEAAPDETGAAPAELDFTQVTAPFPDESYSGATRTRLTALDVPGKGFGSFTHLLSWAGRVQGTDAPKPFTSIRSYVLTGAFDGDFGAGGGDDDALAAAVRDGAGPIARFADAAGTGVEIVDAGRALAPEHGDTMTDAACLDAMRRGAALADTAADSGADLIVVGALGEALRTAAVALTAHATNGDAIGWLPRVSGEPGAYDDAAWMRRAAAVRDALTQARPKARRAPVMLRALGGPALALATGLIVGAALRRTPVLYDGPVAAAAAIVARDLTLGAPKWCYAPDHGPHKTVAKVNDLIGYLPVVDLGMDVSEGATALALLPLVNTVLGLTAALPVRVEDRDDGDAT